MDNADSYFHDMASEKQHGNAGTPPGPVFLDVMLRHVVIVTKESGVLQ